MLGLPIDKYRCDLSLNLSKHTSIRDLARRQHLYSGACTHLAEALAPSSDLARWVLTHLMVHLCPAFEYPSYSTNIQQTLRAQECSC